MSKRNKLDQERRWCELEIAEGLESIALNELKEKIKKKQLGKIKVNSGAIQLEYAGDLRRLLQLHTSNAVYVLQHFAVSRPKALLGHEHFHDLLNLIAQARSVVGENVYSNFHLSAAGSNSSVMNRLKDELSNATHLSISENEGDLLLRIRRTKKGWDVLVRISPRPSATRAWRVADMEGALNAPTAYAMVRLTQPKPDDIFLNIACGSGTLIVERCNFGTAKSVIGVDIANRALGYAYSNLRAAKLIRNISLLQSDIRQLPLPDERVNVICGDLPFGQLVGSHEENIALYPQLIAEAGRVAQPNAIFVLITHEVRLIERVLRDYQDQWSTEQVLKIAQRGLHPRIFVLRKKS